MASDRLTRRGVGKKGPGYPTPLKLGRLGECLICSLLKGDEIKEVSSACQHKVSHVHYIARLFTFFQLEEIKLCHW